MNEGDFMTKLVTFNELPDSITSEYINTGFSTEKLNIKNTRFDLENRIAKAKVDVLTDFVNSYGGNKDNSYHWSAITAYRAVSQLAIAYICLQLGKPKIEVGEIMQISSSMATTAPITQTKNVPVKLEFPKYIERGKRLLGEMNFDIAGKTFYGSIRFAVDLNQQLP